MARATVAETGEVLELPDVTPEQVLDSYRLVNAHLEAYEELKKQLQVRAADIVGDDGTYRGDRYMLRVSATQRFNYDKAVLREVFDQDLLETFLEPAKGRIDIYVKEHLDELGGNSTLLRQSMVAVGAPFRVVRLERLDR